MKRILAIILALTLIITLSACGEKTASGGNKTSTAATEVKHSGKKIKGEITGASVFSEGLAFVCLDGDKEKTYCINKDGYIVFELDKKLVVNGVIDEKFINGYTLIDGGVCNTKGEITYPETVGASKFYNIAFEGGYILALKTTADYSSSKQEIGIMNMDFEWVIQPSEKIYKAIEEDLWTIEALNTKSFYSDDVVYFEESKRYLNLKSGEISESSDVALPSDKWQVYTDNTYRDFNENVILDLSNHNNVNISLNSYFKNGKAPVKFDNREAGTQYFTVINEKGEFLFEPKEVKNISDIGYFYFDGENVLILDSFYSTKAAQCYNTKGELIGEFDCTTVEKNWSHNLDINDGIITMTCGYNYSHKCYYYNTDFTPLF